MGVEEKEASPMSALAVRIMGIRGNAGVSPSASRRGRRIGAAAEENAGEPWVESAERIETAWEADAKRSGGKMEEKSRAASILASRKASPNGDGGKPSRGFEHSRLGLAPKEARRAIVSRRRGRSRAATMIVCQRAGRLSTDPSRRRTGALGSAPRSRHWRAQRRSQRLQAA